MKYAAVKPHVLAILEAAGFDPRTVTKVALNTSGMVVTVYETDDEGRRSLNATLDAVRTTDVHIEWDGGVGEAEPLATPGD